jgi:hypothetical protein
VLHGKPAAEASPHAANPGACEQSKAGKERGRKELAQAQPQQVAPHCVHGKRCSHHCCQVARDPLRPLSAPPDAPPSAQQPIWRSRVASAQPTAARGTARPAVTRHAAKLSCEAARAPYTQLKAWQAGSWASANLRERRASDLTSPARPPATNSSDCNDDGVRPQSCKGPGTQRAPAHPLMAARSGTICHHPW